MIDGYALHRPALACVCSAELSVGQYCQHRHAPQPTQMLLTAASVIAAIDAADDHRACRRPTAPPPLAPTAPGYQATRPGNDQAGVTELIGG